VPRWSAERFQVRELGDDEEQQVHCAEVGENLAAERQLSR
jgi:hypothetical protein